MKSYGPLKVLPTSKKVIKKNYGDKILQKTYPSIMKHPKKPRFRRKRGKNSIGRVHFLLQLALSEISYFHPNFCIFQKSRKSQTD